MTVESNFLDFTPDEFMAMPHSSRIRLCNLLAYRAEQLAARDPNRREGYFDIAKGWRMLADDMERHTEDLARQSQPAK